MKGDTNFTKCNGFIQPYGFEKYVKYRQKIGCNYPWHCCCESKSAKEYKF